MNNSFWQILFLWLAMARFALAGTTLELGSLPVEPCQRALLAQFLSTHDFKHNVDGGVLIVTTHGVNLGCLGFARNLSDIIKDRFPDIPVRVIS